MEVWPVPLTDAARSDLNEAIERCGHSWPQVEQWLAEGAACIWRIADRAHVLTLGNTDNEIEVLATGPDGCRAGECIGPWEAAMRSFPAHRGMTLRIEARRGWKRLLPHWRAQELENGMVLLKSEID